MNKITNDGVPFQQINQETPPTSSNAASTEPNQQYTLITTDDKTIHRPIEKFRFWKDFERPEILASNLNSSQNFQMKIPLSSHAFLILESFLKESASPLTQPYCQNKLKDSLVASSCENPNREPIINLISLMAEIDSFAESYNLQELRYALTSIIKESENLNLFNANSIGRLLLFIDNDCNSLDHKFIHKFAWLGLTSLFKNDLVLSDLLHQFATKLNIENLSTPNELSNWFQETFSADFFLMFLQTILHNKESALFEKNFDFALSLIKVYFSNYFDQSSSSPYQHFFTYILMTIADQVQTTEQANKFFLLFNELSSINKEANIQFSLKELETINSQGVISANYLNQPQSVLLALAYQRIIKNIINIIPHDSTTMTNVSLACFNTICHFENDKEDAIWRILVKILETELRNNPTNGLDFIPLALEIKLNRKLNYALPLLKKNFADYFDPLNPSPNEQIFTYMLTSIAVRIETAEQAKKLFQFLEALYSTNENSSISPGLQRDLLLITLQHVIQNFMKEETHDIPKIAEVIVQCFNCFKNIGADNEPTIWHKIGKIEMFEFPNLFQFPNTKKGQLENIHFLIKFKNFLETRPDISQNSINKIFVPLEENVSDWEEEDVDNIFALVQYQLPSKPFEKILTGVMKSGISHESKNKIVKAFQNRCSRHFMTFNLLKQGNSYDESSKNVEMQKIIDLWINKDYEAVRSLLKSEMYFFRQLRYLGPFVDLFCKQRGVVDAFEFFYSLKDLFNPENWQFYILEHLSNKPLNCDQIIQFLTHLKENNQPFYIESLFKFLKLTIQSDESELRNEILGKIIEHLKNSESNLQMSRHIVPWPALFKLKDSEPEQLEELAILLTTKGFNEKELQLNYPYLCAIDLHLEKPLLKFSELPIKEQTNILTHILALRLPNKVFSKALEMSMELYKSDSFSKLDQTELFNDLLINKMFKHGMTLTPKERQYLFRSSHLLSTPNDPKKLIKLLFMQYFSTPNKDFNKELIKSSLVNLLSKGVSIIRRKDENSYDLIEEPKGKIQADAMRSLQLLRKIGKKLAPHGIEELKELRNLLPPDFSLVLTLKFFSDDKKKQPVDILNLFSCICFDRCESIIYSALQNRLPKITIEHHAELVNEAEYDDPKQKEKIKEDSTSNFL